MCATAANLVEHVLPGMQSTYYCSPIDGGGLVCGCDGMTYPYACIANAEGVDVFCRAYNDWLREWCDEFPDRQQIYD